MYPSWRQLMRHVRDRHDTQPLTCKNAHLGCSISMARSRKSQMFTHESRCKYDRTTGGPKKNPRIHSRQDRETPVRDEAMSISNQLSPVPAPISPLPKSPLGPVMQPTINLPITTEEQGTEEIVTQSAVKINQWTPLIPVDNSEEHRSLYDGLHLDPRFFFLGAPSSASQEVGAKILHDLKESAIQQRRRDVTIFPPKLDHIKKVESAVLPDGTIYKLQSYWYQSTKVSKSVSTQTENKEDIFQTEKVDATTQCTVKLQLAD